MKKSFILAIISLVFVFVFSTSAFAYEDGLLQSKLPDDFSGVTNPANITDNVLDSSGNIVATGFIEYDLQGTSTIGKIYVNESTYGLTDIKFYDSFHNLLARYDTVSPLHADIDGIRKVNSQGYTNLVTPVSNVRYIEIVNTTAHYAVDVSEFDVYGLEPEAPTNLIASGGNEQINLYWDSVDGAESYNIKRSLNAEGPYTVVDSVYDPLYTDLDVMNGTTYYYVVTAIAEGVESDSSNEASATPTLVHGQSK